MPPVFRPASTSSALDTDRNEIRRIAALARVRLSAEEEDTLVTHLHRMLSYVENLSAVNTNNVQPLAYAADSPAVMREDRVTNQPNTEALLHNAPTHAGDFFVVPRILD